MVETAANAEAAMQWFSKGMESADAGDLPKAVRLMEKAVGLNPSATYVDKHQALVQQLAEQERDQRKPSAGASAKRPSAGGSAEMGRKGTPTEAPVDATARSAHRLRHPLAPPPPVAPTNRDAPWRRRRSASADRDDRPLPPHAASADRDVPIKKNSAATPRAAPESAATPCASSGSIETAANAEAAAQWFSKGSEQDTSPRPFARAILCASLSARCCLRCARCPLCVIQRALLLTRHSLYATRVRQFCPRQGWRAPVQ
ncbi:hypothetical protein T492DRAFT_248251 [Pavlovales sp. CCMP2436]|nr:hypothetical protein T492DRAFT_248251 [Pavlovales sp. CCMP2436]